MQPDSIGADRPSDILEGLLAHICKDEVEPAGRVLLNPSGYANPARIGERFEPRGDIDSVAKNVAILEDDVALMDADAQLDAAVWRTVATPISYFALDPYRTAERIDDADELDEKPVAGGLDQPAAMRRNRRVDHLGPNEPEPMQRAFLVGTDQARIARDIGRQDRRQPAFSAILPRGVHRLTA